jgi:hypothetical protein
MTREEFIKARREQEAADRQTRAFADLCADVTAEHIRDLSHYYAKRLKRALRGFNMHTGRWGN